MRLPPDLRAVWTEATRLAAPVAVEKVLRTLMRTTDVFVAGLFSPAAVAAVGIGDSFSRIVNRVGSGIGDATIALSSQDTGAGAVENRNQAVTQAIIVGAVLGLPFLVFGALLSELAIALLGADPAVVRFGGQYLGLILMAAPVIHLSRICTKAIQGTGDTKTPMYIRGFGNVLNIAGTLVLAFGLGPFPRLSVVGIAGATVVGETVTTVLYLAVIAGPWSELAFVRPTDPTILRQIFSLSLPRFAEGVTVVFADLPFNAVLLAIGTEANAAYHIARRVSRQVIQPIMSGFSVSANILVGRSLESDPATAYRHGGLTTALAVGVAVLVGAGLFAGAPLLARTFTNDPATAVVGAGFVRAFALKGVVKSGYRTLKGALRGGSDTRTPFVATVTGMFGVLVLVSYVGGIRLGFGVTAVYLALVLDSTWRMGLLGAVYYRRNWVDHGTQLMEDRGSLSAAPGTDN